MKKLSVSRAYVSIPIPFEADGAVAYDKLAENIARWSRLEFERFRGSRRRSQMMR